MAKQIEYKSIELKEATTSRQADGRLKVVGARAAQEAMVGREVQVLYEKAGRRPGQMVGKSDHLHAVHVEHPEGQVGQLVRVRVTASASNSLAAEPVSGAVRDVFRSHQAK